MCCLVEVHLPLESWSMSGEGNFGRNMFFTAFTSPGYMQLEAVVLASFTACQDHRSYEAKTLLLLQLLLLLLAQPIRHMSSLLLSKGFWETSSYGTGNPYLLERKFQGWKGGVAYPPPPPRVHFASLAIQTPMHTGLSPACPQEVRLLLIK